MRKAVILDRDGTLIVDKIYLNSVDEVEYLPGVFEALRIMRDLGFILFVATNQSGLARGIVQIENMDAVHKRISHDFAKYGVHINGFYYAPYSTTSHHTRRKPNPGMLLDAARDHGFDLKRSWMIGDRMTDVEAGQQAGCRSILLHGIESTPCRKDLSQFTHVSNLLEAAKHISRVLQNETSSRS